MKNWMNQHLRALVITGRRLTQVPLSSLLNIMVMGIALSLPAGLYVVLQSMQHIVNQARSNAEVSVFLNLKSSDSDIIRLGNQLRQHPGIKQVKLVPRDQALAQLKLSLGIADVAGALTQNPLPDAYLVSPKKQDTAALEVLRDELLTWRGIEHVQIDSAWAQKLDAILALGQLTTLILAILLGVALVAVTFNTIRLQILIRHQEIEVSALIGATQTFIRRPFLYFGVMQGVLGGGVAWLIITLCLFLLNSSLAGVTQLYGSDFNLPLLTPRDSFKLLIFPAFLGWIGAWLSVAQHFSDEVNHN